MHYSDGVNTPNPLTTNPIAPFSQVIIVALGKKESFKMLIKKEVNWILWGFGALSYLRTLPKFWLRHIHKVITVPTRIGGWKKALYINYEAVKSTGGIAVKCIFLTLLEFCVIVLLKMAIIFNRQIVIL